MARVTPQHIDNRRESILTAAARLFARKGVSSATMADIAGEADLSAGALYRYFSGKEELLRAVFDDAVQRNQELFQLESTTAGSPLNALKNIGHRIWVVHDDRDALICEIQMSLTAAREPDDFGLDLSRNRRETRELLQTMVEAAQNADEIDSEVDPATMALILQATTVGIQILKLEDGENVDVEAAFKLMVQMVTNQRSDLHDSTERDS